MSLDQGHKAEAEGLPAHGRCVKWRRTLGVAVALIFLLAGAKRVLTPKGQTETMTAVTTGTTLWRHASNHRRQTRSKRASADKIDVQVWAAYWPQWHATPLNDYWFGDGYTDWSLLCNQLRIHTGMNRNGERLIQPLSPPHGLGWYNLSDLSVRRRQGQLAKEHGLYGFAIYHFWFERNASWGHSPHWKTGKNGAGHGADMDETLMMMLEDNEPDIPFYFVWANEAFVWKWTTWNTGRVSTLPKNAIQVPQTYPEDGWRPHFDYLLPFFRHKNYHKIDGNPVFGNFMTDRPEPPAEMWDKFREWAIEAGFPGIYYIQYFHGKQKHKQAKQWEKGASLKGRFAPWADAVQDFGWNFGFKEHRVASKRYHEPWNYGMIVDFDNTPRKGIKAAALGGKFRGGPRHLAAGLDTLMAATVSSAEVTGRKEAMVLLIAFNEWTEQAVLEPSDRWGASYLQAIEDVLHDWGQYHYSGKRGLWNHTSVFDREHRLPTLTECGQLQKGTSQLTSGTDPMT